jgi:hypothetical protein
VNSFVLWGTAIPVRSGTRSACFRGPKSREIFRSTTACGARNFPNQLNLTCCEPAGCEQVDWRDQFVRFQCLTHIPIRQYDFVFGDTSMRASVRASTRLSLSPVSNVHRHATPVRKSRRGELANLEFFGDFPTERACSASEDCQRTAGEFAVCTLLSWNTGRDTTITLHRARFPALQRSRGGEIA